MIEIVRSAYQHPLLTGEDIQKIAKFHQKEQIGKGEILLKEGEIANEYYLLQKGLIRAYVLDFDGNEITTEFFAEGDIVIVPSSLFQRSPAEETLMAVTEATLWRIRFDAFQELFHSIPGFSEWGRLWFTQQLFAVKQRSLEMIRETATNRYLKLLEAKPQIIQQAPLKHIASYLGITDTSLSRIRKEITH